MGLVCKLGCSLTENKKNRIYDMHETEEHLDQSSISIKRNEGELTPITKKLRPWNVGSQTFIWSIFPLIFFLEYSTEG